MSDKNQSSTEWWKQYLGSVVRRYFLIMLLLGAAGAVIGLLNAAWGPIGLILVIAAVIVAVALLWRSRQASPPVE